MSSVVKWLPAQGGAGSGLSEFTVQTASGSCIINSSGSILTLSSTDLSISANSGTDTVTANIATGAITNTHVSASAAIAYSKLATLNTGQVLLGNAGTPTATTLGGDATVGATGTLTIANNAVTDAKFRQSAARSVVCRAGSTTGNVADLSTTSASNMVLAENGAGSLTFKLIVNNNISASAAIAFSKMAALTASRAVVTTAGGVITTSATTAAEVDFLSGVTSNIQSQITARGYPDISHYRRTSAGSFVRYVTFACVGGDPIDVALDQDKVYYIPITITRTYSISKVACEVTATGMSEFMMGIYRSSDGAPSSRLAATGVLSESVSAFDESLATDLTPGQYWLAIITKSTGGTFRGKPANQILNVMSMLQTLGSTPTPIGYTEDHTWDSTLPANAAVDAHYSGSFPLIGINYV